MSKKLTDKQIVDIMTEVEEGKGDYREDATITSHTGFQMWVGDYSLKTMYSLTTYIESKLSGEMIEPLVIEANFKIDDNALLKLDKLKNKMRISNIVLRAKHSHGLRVPWTAILRLFHVADTVIIDAERVCLFGSVGESLEYNEGVLDISSVHYLWVNDFRHVYRNFKRIVYNAKSRSLNMLGIYFHQKFDENRGTDIYRLQNGKDVCVRGFSLDLEKLGSVQTLAVLWEIVDKPLEIINFSGKSMHIPRIINFGRNIEIKGDVTIGELMFVSGETSASKECRFFDDVIINTVTSEPIIDDYPDNANLSKMNLSFVNKAKIGRIGTKDNMYKESLLPVIMASGQKVEIGEIYAANELTVLASTDISFGTVVTKGIEVHIAKTKSEEKPKITIENATLSTSKLNNISRIDKLIVPYADAMDTFDYKGISLGDVVIDVRNTRIPATIPGTVSYLARNMHADTVNILTDETTAGLNCIGKWLDKSSVREFYINDKPRRLDESSFGDECTRESEWIAKAQLMGIIVKGNSVDSVPSSITRLDLPDYIKLDNFVSFQGVKLNFLSVGLDNISLSSLVGQLDKRVSATRITVDVLELREYKQKQDNYLNENAFEYIENLVEGGGISRIVIGAKVRLTRAFMYKVRDNQCEVIFKKVIGNPPNIVWKENSRGRVICESYTGELAEELVCANTSFRKRVIQRGDDIIINAKAGKELVVHEVLEKAKIEAGHRKVYVVVRGKDKINLTHIKSYITLTGIVVESESTVDLRIDTEMCDGVEKVVAYGTVGTLFGDSSVGKIVLSKQPANRESMRIYGLNIGEITTLFKMNALLNEGLCLDLGSILTPTQVEKISEFLTLTIEGNVNIKVVERVGYLWHEQGKLDVEYAAIGNCEGLGGATRIKEIRHCTEYNPQSWTGAINISGYCAESITVSSEGYLLYLYSKDDVCASKMVIEGNVRDLEFLSEAKSVDKVVINGDVCEVGCNLGKYVGSRVFINGVVAYVGGGNEWVTESGRFKRCENKGFLYFQGTGE